MVKGIDQVNTEGFNKNTNLSIQEIKRILEGHFSELETLKDTHLHLFTSENREVSQTLLHEFSEEIIRIWGMPPYNEYLVDPRIAEDGVFDAFPHQKVGRPRNVDFQEDDELSTKLWKHINEDDLRSRLEKAIENKWPKFWSVDRVKQYFEKILSKKNSFISIVTDSEGRIVAWLIMYEVNPTELLGVNVIDNEGNIVEEAIYLDTSGFGYNYRLKENKPIKSEIEVSLASAFSKIAELTDGKVVGRSLIDDSKVAQAAQRILGFTTTSISPESDPSRVYSLKGDMRVIDEVTTEGKEFINVEDTYNGLLERFLSSTEILYIEQTLKDRIEGSHIKIKKLLLESIDKYLETTKISEEERETLEEYRTQINSGVLFQDLFERYRSLEGVTDLIIGGPGAILLSISPTFPFSTTLLSKGR